MEDEEDFTSPLDFATSLSGMARQADVDVKTQIQKYREMVEAGTRRMREQRIGPSSTERLLALAQALGKPTRTGKFGERIGLIAGTLGGQESARREAELARADTLEKLGLKSAEFDVEAAQTRANRLSTLAARQLAAEQAAAARGGVGVVVGADFIPRNKRTGAIIKEAPANVVYTLQDYINDPEQTPEDKRAALRNFDSTYGFGAAQMYLGGK
jgi:hypothetical protein